MRSYDDYDPNEEKVFKEIEESFAKVAQQSRREREQESIRQAQDAQVRDLFRNSFTRPRSDTTFSHAVRSNGNRVSGADFAELIGRINRKAGYSGVYGSLRSKSKSKRTKRSKSKSKRNKRSKRSKRTKRTKRSKSKPPKTKVKSRLLRKNRTKF
jgi:hypothetical protein